MTSHRKKRLLRVIDLRNQELERCIKVLEEAQTRKRHAEQAEESAHKKAQEAFEARRGLAASPIQVHDWTYAEAWLRRQRAHAEQAERSRREADQAVAEARRELLSARSNLDRLESLMTRWTEEERAAEERASRKLEDELATRSAQTRRTVRQGTTT